MVNFDGSWPCHRQVSSVKQMSPASDGHYDIPRSPLSSGRTQWARLIHDSSSPAGAAVLGDDEEGALIAAKSDERDVLSAA